MIQETHDEGTYLYMMRMATELWSRGLLSQFKDDCLAIRSFTVPLLIIAIRPTCYAKRESYFHL